MSMSSKVLWKCELAVSCGAAQLGRGGGHHPTSPPQHHGTGELFIIFSQKAFVNQLANVLLLYCTVPEDIWQIQLIMITNTNTPRSAARVIVQPVHIFAHGCALFILVEECHRVASYASSPQSCVQGRRSAGMLKCTKCKMDNNCTIIHSKHWDRISF